MCCLCGLRWSHRGTYMPLAHVLRTPKAGPIPGALDDASEGAWVQEPMLMNQSAAKDKSPCVLCSEGSPSQNG